MIRIGRIHTPRAHSYWLKNPSTGRYECDCGKALRTYKELTAHQKYEHEKEFMAKMVAKQEKESTIEVVHGKDLNFIKKK